MATLNVTEHSPLVYSGNDSVPALSMPPAAEQQLTISGASAESAAFTGGLLRLHTDTACRIKVAATGTATAVASTAFVMSANTAVVIKVAVGGKLAVIAV
jgi:hypothetical protein